MRREEVDITVNQDSIKEREIAVCTFINPLRRYT